MENSNGKKRIELSQTNINIFNRLKSFGYKMNLYNKIE